MLWRKWRRDRALANDEAIAQPVEFALDGERFRHHIRAFTELAKDEAQGIDAYLHALQAKHERVLALINVLRERALAMDELEMLLGQVFTARRRLYPVIDALGSDRVSAILRDIAFGAAPVEQRLQVLVDAVPSATATDHDSLRAMQRMRRAAWDFGAEVLHFGAPQTYPLMCRWVWESGTRSGALRELAPAEGSAGEPQWPAGTRAIEAACAWLSERVRETGIYRDIHWWIDLVLAQAYVGYLGATAQGHLGADFVRGTSTPEQLRKLLGIDAERASGRSRVNRVAVSVS